MWRLARHCGRGGGSVTTALATVAMLLPGLSEAREFLGPEFCATQFQSSRGEVKQGMQMLAILYRDGQTRFERMTPQQWVSCICPKGDEPCNCCDYDPAKVCAELDRLSRVTNDRMHLPVCERGRR
jgi:hypothetical protein